MKTVLADLGHDSLKPLTYTKSSTDLEIGGKTVFEHLDEGLESEEVDVLVPKYLEEITEKNTELYGIDRKVNSRPEGKFLIYNSTVVPNKEIREGIEELTVGQGLYYNDTFIAGVTDTYPEFSELDEFVKEFESNEIDEEPVILEYPWDIVQNNGDLIEQSFPGEEINGDLSDDAVVKGDSGLYLGEEAEIRANATIDTSDGPVYIGRGTKVWPESRIEGPVYIGDYTKIGAGQNAVIHENTHIGDANRTGGEIEDTVVNSFSNKYHYGFLGHSVVGSWVNFGAGTTNSDLKNTYGEVTVNHPVEGEIDAGLKVGSTVGDHTKTDIQTGVYTGKQIGPVARIAGKVTGNVGPFTWQNPDKELDYITDKAILHAERMMNRREEHLPDGYIEAQKNLIRELSEKV